MVKHIHTYLYGSIINFFVSQLNESILNIFEVLMGTWSKVAEQMGQS